jgi:hypothetical protein
MADIPNSVATIEGMIGEIPPMVAELNQDTVAIEVKPYHISFEKYNNKLCEIDSLGKNKGNKALSILKEIGTKVSCRADFQRHKIQNDSIRNEGEYKKLYSKIDDGIEIKELFLQGTGRIFYFDIEPEKILHVVAIKENHFEVGKNRR